MKSTAMDAVFGADTDFGADAYFGAEVDFGAAVAAATMLSLSGRSMPARFGGRAGRGGDKRGASVVAAALAVIACLAPAMAGAGVVKVEIASRTPYADGREFPGVGAYETLRGKVRFAVDPAVPANRGIVDLELAQRNAQGLVEFSADVEILAPVERARGNGALLYDVNNRGNKLAMGQFNTGADEFLMRRGYTVVWSGWIAETAPGGGRLRLQAPVALEDGRPLVGIVRSEVVVDSAAPSANLGQWANKGSYEPTAKGEAEATLTWRLRESDPRVAIPRSQWRLEKRWPEADGERGQAKGDRQQEPATQRGERTLVELTVRRDGGRRLRCVRRHGTEFTHPVILAFQ